MSFWSLLPNKASRARPGRATVDLEKQPSNNPYPRHQLTSLTTLIMAGTVMAALALAWLCQGRLGRRGLGQHRLP